MHEEIEEILKRFDDPTPGFYNIEALTAASGFVEGSFHSMFGRRHYSRRWNEMNVRLMRKKR